MHKASAALLAAALLGGCSTFSGTKLGNVGDRKIEPTGIPYTLSKPAYKLTQISPATDKSKAVYGLDVSYVPDPKHTYSLKVSPSWFADPNFTMQLSNGTLQATSAKFTDQLVPAISALGSFVANVIGAFAILDRTKAPTLRGLVAKEVATNGADACTAAADLPVMPWMSTKPAQVRHGIAQRIESYADDAEFLTQFHYVTAAEKDCLAAVAKGWADASETSFRNALGQHRNAYPQDNEFSDKLDAAVNREDATILAPLQKELAAAKDSPDPIHDSRDKALRAASERVLLGKDNKALQAVKAAVEMQPRIWRARHTLYLERQLDDAQIHLLRHPRLDNTSSAAIRKAIVAMEQERAETLGVAEEHRRKVVLETFVRSIRTKDVEGGRAPATAEYATARAELEAVRTQIEARRTTLLAENKPPAPPTPPLFTPREIPVVDAKFVASNQNKPGWGSTNEGKAAPDYVLVLEEK